ncbi:Bug family tripartite tricarboxylate transporter substrate binding protein [Humitalea sp. 24SJ18S-53]|uniref:Bug family tripartite tricarboxylate transporter substrate binding protein n=1 Tax=Humitalea sp. 24SJ18S-53 TaxID=3422307 RepID=UPI003D667C92
MTLPRRTLLALPALASTAQAQPAWPNRPIRLLVGFAPGGAIDIVARLVAPALAARLGQPVVVENRAGAGGNIAAEVLANATADGHTLMLATPGPLTVNPAIYRHLPFDPARSFAPVAQLGVVLDVLAVPAARPWQTTADVIAAAKAAPGALNVSHSGVGSGSHVGIALLRSLTGIDVLEVPYGGGGPMMADFLSGKLDATIGTAPVLVPLARAGRIRILGVAQNERSVLLPGVPAMAEAVPGYDLRSWFGLVAPAGTPASVIDRLHHAAATALAEPEIVARLQQQVTEPAVTDPAAFARMLAEERARWAPLMRAANVTVE